MQQPRSRFWSRRSGFSRLVSAVGTGTADLAGRPTIASSTAPHLLPLPAGPYRTTRPVLRNTSRPGHYHYGHSANTLGSMVGAPLSETENPHVGADGNETLPGVASWPIPVTS